MTDHSRVNHLPKVPLRRKANVNVKVKQDRSKKLGGSGRLSNRSKGRR